MESPIGFTLPKADLHRQYLRLIPLGVAGIAVPVMLGLTSVYIGIVSAALGFSLVGGVYLYTLRHMAKWIELGSSGIQGFTATGAKVVIPWPEPVQLERKVAFRCITCIAVQPMSKNAALMLPLSIATNPEFRAALECLAPNNHPLRNMKQSVL